MTFQDQTEGKAQATKMVERLTGSALGAVGY